MLMLATDTFITLADADAYLGFRLRAHEWGIASEADREAALRMATATISRERFAGRIANQNQALAWPRTGVTDPEGRPVPTNAIPAAIAHATAELALFLLRYDITDDRIRRGVFNVRSERIGESAATFDASGSGDTLPALVRDMIAPYQAVASTHSARLIP